jgi:pimeloyl-ACP methyl ester carboxylesterase
VRDRLTRSAEFPRWAHVAALTYQMIYEQPVRAEFSKIARPTLLIIGQTDRTAVGKMYAPPDVRKTLGNYPALGKAAAADISGAKLVELENVGHIPHLEAPDDFHPALIEFLQQK